MVVHQCGVDRGCDCINLRCVSGSEYRQYAESGKQVSQEMPFFAKAVFDVVHRSADELAVGVFLTVEDSQCNLRKFRTHAEQGRNPHPEHRTRSADRDSTGDTGNITGTDRSGQRRTDRLERSNCTVGRILFPEHSSDRRADCIREFSNLEKTGAQT